MEDTDFDFLCEGSSPEESKRLRKILKEWCEGNENDFPVQLALLVRAQWRMAASIPRSMGESRKLTEAHLAEYRRQTASLLNNFSHSTAELSKEFKAALTEQAESTKQTKARMDDQLLETEALARKIRETMESGSEVWNRAKEQYAEACRKLDKARLELDDRLGWQSLLLSFLNWVAIGFLGYVLGLFLGQ